MTNPKKYAYSVEKKNTFCAFLYLILSLYSKKKEGNWMSFFSSLYIWVNWIIKLHFTVMSYFIKHEGRDGEMLEANKKLKTK